jgi:hypothetical protein
LVLLYLSADGNAALKGTVPPLRVTNSSLLLLSLLLLFLLTFEDEKPRFIGDLNIVLIHAGKLSFDTDLSLILGDRDLWLKLSLTRARESDRLPYVLKS